MKILIIGFQRSGTTLLKKLMLNHPDIEHIIHEKRILNKAGAVDKLTYTGHWGEKVPWNSGHGREIIDYSRKWLNEFGQDARIIHIIRHPVDVGLSNSKLGWMDLQTAIDFSMGSIPKVISALRVKQYMAVTFEDLVSGPADILEKLFDFCGLSSADDIINDTISLKKDKLKYFDNINSDRAFVYKKEKNLNCRIPDYNKILELI